MAAEVATVEWFQIGYFVFMYYLYLLMTIVLLLNLLIAMMNHTFLASQQVHTHTLTAAPSPPHATPRHPC